MELERRKVHELQDSSREREKEYQKLKVAKTLPRGLIYSQLHQAQYDKAKRKSLLAPSTAPPGQSGGGVNMFDRPPQDDHNKGRSGVDIGAVIGGMDANGVQDSYCQVDFT
jgi:E3 ubiquitin-protein ligase CCNP1IP1